MRVLAITFGIASATFNFCHIAGGEPPQSNDIQLSPRFAAQAMMTCPTIPPVKHAKPEQTLAQQDRAEALAVGRPTPISSALADQPKHGRITGHAAREFKLTDDRKAPQPQLG